jgi:hypothetical protein
VRPKSTNPGEDILYHVTLASNHDAIARMGIEPMFAKGAKKASWWVDETRIYWALAHCSTRYDASVLQLEVWAAPKKSFPRLLRFRWPGIFFTTCRIKTSHCHPASRFVQEPNNHE